MLDKEFVKEFLNVFAKNEQPRKIKKFYNGSGFLWEFIVGKASTFEGKQARIEYDKADKANAFEIQYFNGVLGDKETLPLQPTHLTAQGIDVDSSPEFYVIGENFSWCYVVTHEGDRAGPYFCYSTISQ